MGNSRILTDIVLTFRGNFRPSKSILVAPAELWRCASFIRFLGGRLQTGSHSPHALHDHLNSWLGCIMIQWTWCIIPRTPHKTYPCLCSFHWIRFDPPPLPPKSHLKKHPHQTSAPSSWDWPWGLIYTVSWAKAALDSARVGLGLGHCVYICCLNQTWVRNLMSSPQTRPPSSAIQLFKTLPSAFQTDIPWNLVRAMLGASLGLRYGCGLHLNQDSQV